MIRPSQLISLVLLYPIERVCALELAKTAEDELPPLNQLQKNIVRKGINGLQHCQNDNP